MSDTYEPAEAVKYDEDSDNYQDVINWLGGRGPFGPATYMDRASNLNFRDPSGKNHRIRPGDWVIREAGGQHHVVTERKEER